MAIEWEPDRRPKRGLWAPGNYHCECSECGVVFTGDKRAQWCADCAYTIAQEETAMTDKWVTVPVEPTVEMLNVATTRIMWDAGTPGDTALRAYQSMLAAAPKPAELAPAVALGFAWSFACSALDKGRDPRNIEIPELLEAWDEACRVESARVKEGAL